MGHTVSQLSRLNGNGHEATSESVLMYQAGFEAGFAAGKQSGYRQGFEAGVEHERVHASEPAPVAVNLAAPAAGKRPFLGLPCPTCGAYFYTDEECPRCQPRKA